MRKQYYCPKCNSGDLDNGSFDYDGISGVRTHTPTPLHFNCLDCGWSGSDPAEPGDYESMLDDKADGEREERMLAAWAETQAMKDHNSI